MSLREDIARKLIAECLAEEKSYDFPSFIKHLRQVLGISQSYVSRQAKIRPHHLFNYESSTQFRSPPDEDLKKLADYYGIPQYILITKRNAYESSNK